MSLSRAFLFFLTLGLATTLQAADPVTFHEISLLVRSGQTGQDIVNETARRGLLQPLTAEEETTLHLQGGSTSLITALRTPSLLATPEQVAAYNGRRTSGPGKTRAPIAPSPSEPPVPSRPAGPMLISNPFPEGLEAARKSKPRVMQITDAYRLDELPQAISRAQSERKPLGFVMVSGSMFAGKAYSSRYAGGGAGLVHFYEAFKDSLVLVFVRQETEQAKVPNAVKAGFQGPDSGAGVPNMAVVDATANELIVEIPLGGPKASGEQRDAIFQAGAAKAYEWLTYHPNAVAQAPAPR